ncbi:metallopeptidase [Pochonia chlamydosporia 170]|uniref:Metallopeptidase n=1 Tax=Pochonia chlamydosporia 170 TaxID=1380566 RepID=A0A179FMP3_METCM|nr:metallopeptidase [Pochonia chlamydosporia 170]OAQ66852.1 metallopeptidase [Pochonia chlamydosporia 170]
MAFWVVGGGHGRPLQDGEYATRRHANNQDVITRQSGNSSDYFNTQGELDSHHSDAYATYDYNPRYSPNDQAIQSVPIQNLAFLVIREAHAHDSAPSPSPSPKPPNFDETSASFHSRSSIPVPLERTESGLSISSDTTAHQHANSTEDDRYGSYLGDSEAARFVRKHLATYQRRFPDSQPERILKALIKPRFRGAEFALDNDALKSIFSASNELFFANRLTQRVIWDWSHSLSGQYKNHIVGTTAIRRSACLGGWETLIVLSSPILRDTQYNRRLLISTFLHEMIHSFMFVTCGLKAQQDGGHTSGFRQIAGIIDDWAGNDCLRLRDMEADLSRWRGDDFSSTEYSHGLDDIHGASSFEQTGWSSNHAYKHEDYLQPPLPRRHAPPEEWQLCNREDFGDHAQVVANLQYGSEQSSSAWA